jgi:hypothetical protein
LLQVWFFWKAITRQFQIHKDKPYYLFSPPNMWVIKSREGCTGHVEDRRGTYRETPEERTPAIRTRQRW